MGMSCRSKIWKSLRTWLCDGYHADNSIPANIEDWLDQFDMFSIYEVLPQILELWGENLVTDVTSKKRLAEVSGK
mgnify:CR=1 FL=1